jgi:hypothetical protein
MTQWEYCEVDFDGSVTKVWYYDEAGDYIDQPTEHARLGIILAQLGHDQWELVSTWWRSPKEVTYMLKRPCQNEWTKAERESAKQSYRENHPKDRKYSPSK